VYAVAFTSFGQECILRLRKPMVNNDQHQLQNDLQQLEILEKKWQMQLNADKCFTIHLTNEYRVLGIPESTSQMEECVRLVAPVEYVL
jgi:hypothetical protein